MKHLNIYLGFSIFIILIFSFPVFNLSAQYESVTLEDQAQSYCKKGWNLLKEGRMEEAILNYKKAIELNPGFAQAYGDLGIIFEVKGEMKKAEEMYLKAIEAAPDYLNSYSNLALLYEKQGDYAKAIFYWKKRLDLSESTDPYAEVAEKRLDELMRLHPQAHAPLKIEDEKPAEEISKFKTENSELIAQLNKLKVLNEQLKTRVGELQNLSQMADLREKDIAKLNNAIESKDQELFVLKQKPIALKKENEALIEKVKSHEESSKDAAKLKQERFVLETELTKQKELNNNLGEKAEGYFRDLSSKAKDAEQMNEIIKNLNDKLASIIQESSASIKEKEELSLKADTYKKSKEGLEKEFIAEIKGLKRSNAQLETKGKEFYIKALGADQTKNNLKTLNKVVERMNQGQIKLKKENEGLGQKIVLLENTLKSEKARLYDELGTAYTKAKLFDLAIRAYEESLTFNPNSAQVHYNLGLLYKHYLDNSKKAMFHLKKYLELNSKAANRKEVEYLIGMLREKKF
ncbi:MAG: tetratricopeptide repeat protein [Candidatus Omnitrophica bacterium]|nr:tetratricopeptide repeat protein [Candidatus Omnitrophota bacterium]